MGIQRPLRNAVVRPIYKMAKKCAFVCAETTLGRFGVSVCDGAVVRVLPRAVARRRTEPAAPRDTALAARALSQIAAYARGRRTLFDIPLQTHGTPFQNAVWAELQRIPYGQTRTYGDIALAIGHPHAARAVGAACHANPIPIFIPCHRVIGKNGALTGFSCGLALKEKLLALEAKYGAAQKRLPAAAAL